MPLENRLRLLRKIMERNPVFDIEPQIIEWAALHTKIFLERWKKGGAHWSGNEERNNFVGMVGHKCFEAVLQQFEIPYNNNDPTLDWRQKKDYDFRIANVGKVEVKTVDFKANQTRLLVKCAEWHKNDYCLAMKLLDAQPTKAKFVGYATGQEVTKFRYAENEMPCPYDPCRWEFLENLHPANEFLTMLQQKTADLWKT